MSRNRPTIPTRMACHARDIKMKPPVLEHDTIAWSRQPGCRVRRFRVDVDCAVYDLQLTEREFVSTQLSQSQGKRDAGGGGDYDREFTVTIFGWIHVDTHHNPAIGRTCRWREGAYLHGVDFASKMGLVPTDADAILRVLEAGGHSVMLCNPEEGREVSHG